MRFDWDIRKDVGNRRKHGIEFAVAERVFTDPLMRITQDRNVEGEERWQATGRTPAGNLLVVAFAFTGNESDEVVRIISARKATPHERRRFEGSNKT